MDSLAGKTVGFLSNGKEGTKGFFAHLERVLRDEWQVRNVVHVVKPNFSAPAGAALVDDTAHWDLAITGIGD